MNSSSTSRCCLICSVLSSLSDANCCPKHLKLLNKRLSSELSKQIRHMMSSTAGDWSTLECHCQLGCSKSKQSDQSRSSTSSLSSSSSSSSPPPKCRHREKKRSITVQAGSGIHIDDIVVSPNRGQSTSMDLESPLTTTGYQRYGHNRVRTPLSPLYQSYSLLNRNMNHNNKSRRKTKNSCISLVSRNKPRGTDSVESTVQYESHESNSPQISNQSESSEQSPRIRLSRIVHVKDEGEELPIDNPQVTLNMAEATEQMIAQRDSQPKILLTRISMKL